MSKQELIEELEHIQSMYDEGCLSDQALTQAITFIKENLHETIASSN